MRKPPPNSEVVLWTALRLTVPGWILVALAALVVGWATGAMLQPHVGDGFGGTWLWALSMAGFATIAACGGLAGLTHAVCVPVALAYGRDAPDAEVGSRHNRLAIWHVVFPTAAIAIAVALSVIGYVLSANLGLLPPPPPPY